MWKVMGFNGKKQKIVTWDAKLDPFRMHQWPPLRHHQDDMKQTCLEGSPTGDDVVDVEAHITKLVQQKLLGTLPKTNIAPKKWWIGRLCSLYFQGAKLALGRVTLFLVEDSQTKLCLSLVTSMSTK